MVNGKITRIPADWGMGAARQGIAEPPATAAAFMTPMAVGTRLASVSLGVIAMVVGKTGPRKKPSSPRATQVSAIGESQASAAAAVTPAMHAYIMAAVVTPALAAIALIRNRPSVSPSQYPLTA